MARFSNRYQLVNGNNVDGFDSDQFDIALSEWIEACQFSPQPVRLIDTTTGRTAEGCRNDKNIQKKASIFQI